MPSINCEISPIGLFRLHQSANANREAACFDQEHRVTPDFRKVYLRSGLGHPVSYSLAFCRQRIFAQHLTKPFPAFIACSIKACKPASMATGFSLDGQSRKRPPPSSFSTPSSPTLEIKKTEQTGQIVFLFLQVSQVPLIVIPVALDQQPPDGVTAHPVHPARQRRCIADKIKAFRYHLVISENSVDRHHFRMQITNPDQTVTFDAVPNILLHIQMYRISTSLPNPVQPFVVATK